MVAWVEGFWVEDREQERGKRDRESYTVLKSRTFSAVNALVLRGHCDRLRKLMTLLSGVNCGQFWYFGTPSGVNCGQF